EAYFFPRQQEVQRFVQPLADDRDLDGRAGLAAHQVANVRKRKPFGAFPGNVREDVAGPDTLLVSAGPFNGRDHRYFSTAHAEVKPDAAVPAPCDDLDVRVVGLVDEGGVRVEVRQHRVDPRPQ